MARSSSALARPPARNGDEPPRQPAPAGEGFTPRIKAALERSEDRIAAALPRRCPLTPSQVVQVTTLLVYKAPKLQKCLPATIVSSVLEACELGLSLSRSSGEAYLVPYWNKHAEAYECQFQPGYRGLVRLAYQGGYVASIDGRLVRDGDHFELSYDPDLTFRHVPALGAGSDERPITHAYAVAKLLTGERLVRVMTVREIEAIRERSRSKDDGPWKTDWAEMAIKCPVRRICKFLPRSTEMGRALAADDRQYGPVPALAFPGGLTALPPAEEPEFSAEEGTSRPLYSESDGAGEPVPAPEEGGSLS